MPTCLGKSCSFGLPCAFSCTFVNLCVLPFLRLRAGCGIKLYKILIIAYPFTFHEIRLCFVNAC